MEAPKRFTCDSRQIQTTWFWVVMTFLNVGSRIRFKNCLQSSSRSCRRRRGEGWRLSSLSQMLKLLLWSCMKSCCWRRAVPCLKSVTSLSGSKIKRLTFLLLLWNVIYNVCVFLVLGGGCHQIIKPSLKNLELWFWFTRFGRIFFQEVCLLSVKDYHHDLKESGESWQL